MGTRHSERPGDVADALGQRLAANPNDQEAYRALREHYRASGDYASLANLVAGFASFTGDDRAASRAYQEVAEILERHLGDPKRAEGFYRRAVQREPLNLDASEGLHALLAQAGRLSELTEVITTQLDALEQRRADPRDIALLAYRLGELWNKHFDRAEEALAHYRRAYEADPKLLRALYEARVLHVQLGDLRTAASLCEQEASAEPEPARRLLLLRELAALYGDLEDLDGAVSALERAKALAPGDIEITHLLATELVRRGSTLEPRLARGDLERAADLLCELSSALPDDEGLPFLESALTHAPWHGVALTELERRLHPDERPQVLPVYWVGYLAHAPEAPDANARRLALGRAYVAAGQLEDAAFCLREAAARGVQDAKRLLRQLGLDETSSAPTAAPSDDPVTQIGSPALVDDLLRATRSRSSRPAPSPAADSFSDDTHEKDTVRPVDDGTQVDAPEAEPQEDPTWVPSLFPPPADEHDTEPPPPLDTDDDAAPHGDAALFASESVAPRTEAPSKLVGGREDDALGAAEQLFEQDPGNEEAFAVLDRQLRRSRDFAARARLLLRSAEAEALPLPTRRLRLREAVSLLETRLSDLDGAILAYQALDALEPGSEDVMRGLRRLLERAKRWDELAVVLQREIDALQATGAEVELLARLRQLATVHHVHRQDADATYGVCQRILELAPEDIQALDRMEQIDEQTGAHERLLQTLSRRIQRATPAQAADLYVRMATVAEADLLDQQRAAQLLRQALALAPSNLQILTSLANLYERASLHRELVELLRTRLEGEKSPKGRADMYRRIGRVLQQHLDDRAGAAEAYTKVLEIADDREALLFMETQQRDAERWDALAETLGKLVDLGTDDDERRTRLLERARLLDGLHRREEALDALARVLIDVAPADEGAYADLQRISEAAGDHRAHARVLEDRLTRSQEPTERAEFARALASIYEHKQPDEVRAVRALTAWANAAPRDPEPRRRLAAFFERKRRYKEWVETLDELGVVETTDQARRAALQQAAELSLKLKDQDGAWQRTAAWVRASEGPVERAAIDLARRAGHMAQLIDLCEVDGRHDALLSLLRDEIALQRDDAARLALQRRLAAALVEHAHDDAAALQVYEAILQTTEDLEALRFVRAWAERNDDVERLVHALDRLARLGKDRTERRDLWFARGQLLHTRLGRPVDAAAAFESALGVDSGYLPAIDALIDACAATQDHKRLAAALERKLGLTGDGDAQRIPLLRRLADLYTGPASDDRRALQTLERWATEDVDDPAPLRELRVLHERAGRHREALAALEALAEREQDQERRIEAIIAAAQLLQEKLGDVDAALLRLQPIVTDAHPAADAALFAIAERGRRPDAAYDMLEHAERYADLAARLTEAATVEKDKPRAVRLHRRAALVAQRHLHDDDVAAAAFGALLALQEDVEALRFMALRARRQDDAQALSNALLRWSALEGDPAERRDLLFEHAHLLQTRLGRSADAVAVLREVVKLDAGFEPALDELAAAAESAGDDEALAEALEGMLRKGQDDETRAALAERLADLYEGRLHAYQRAVAALRAWSRADTQNIVPLKRLHVRLRELGDARAQIECLDRIAPLEPETADQDAARLEAARVARDLLHDTEQAWGRLLPMVETGNVQAEGMLRELATDETRQEALCVLYDRSARYDDLVELLQRRADAEQDQARKADLYLRCARVLAQSVGDEIAATEAYREVLEMREDPEALAHLRAHAAQLDDVDALDGLLARLAAVRTDREEKCEALLARAMLLADRLDRPAEAVEILRQIVTSVDPNFTQAIEELIATAEATGNLQALAQGLERKLVLSRDTETRASVSRRLADLYEGELQNPELAAEALRQHCEAAPNQVEGLRRYRVHLERKRRHEDLLRVLDTLARLEATKADRHEALLAAARLANDKLSDAQGAFARLAPLVQAGDDEAERLLEAVCKAKNLGRELVGVYLAQAQKAKEREPARAAWRKVVHIHETWLKEPQEAFEASLRLLALDTRDAASLDEVDRLAIAVAGFPRLAQVYGRLVKDAASDEERIALLLRLADLYERHARDPGAALDVLLQACKLAPQDERLLDRTEELTRRVGNHQDLLWLQEQRAGRMQDPTRAIAALLDSARTADIGLGDREQANASLRRAAELTEKAPEKAAAIEELALELDRARPALGKEDARRALVRSYLELAESAKPAFAVALVVRAAAMLKDKLGDDAGSFDVLRQGTSKPPFDDALLDALTATAERIGRLDALNAHLQRTAERAEDPRDKHRLLLRRARVLHEKMQRFDQAAQAYERVLELNPDDEELARQLFECLKRAGRYRELLGAFDRRVARARDAHEKLPLLRAMAKLWEVELKNRASAIEVWNDVRALAPDDAEAAAAIERLGMGARP